MATAACGCGVRVCRTSRARRYCCVTGRARHSPARWSASGDSRGPVERGVASATVRSRPAPGARHAGIDRGRVSQGGRREGDRSRRGVCSADRTACALDLETSRLRRSSVGPGRRCRSGDVATTREGDLCQALIHEPLTCLLAVDVQRDTIRGWNGPSARRLVHVRPASFRLAARVQRRARRASNHASAGAQCQ